MKRSTWSRPRSARIVPLRTFVTAAAIVTIPALAALAALASLAPPAFAQADAGSPPPATSLVHASAAPVSIAAGGHATVRVHFTIAHGWHVNANPPALDYNIPTRVSLKGAFGLSAGKPAYPAPHKEKLAFDPEHELFVWDGNVDVPLPLAAAAHAAAGARTLTGAVDFQSCNDQVCLAPASVPFTVDVTVTGGAGAASGTSGAAGVATDTSHVAAAPADTAARAAAAAPPPGAGFVTSAPAGGAATAPASGAAKQLQDALAKGGVWWFVALFFVGLLLNLTPCVFPMIGITVSIFGARRAEPVPKVVGNAIAYVLGICVMYSALGGAAALTGGLFGAALQNPLVNVGLGLLFVALSLSMFGVYEIQAPAWLLDRVGGGTTGSVAGLFVSGLAVGVVAAPCVGPFVVAVLAIIAQRGNALFGLESMFLLSLGLGFPYLFLAAFSNLLQNLPRSGEWMDWVKKFFGVVLASIGVYYALIGIAPRVAPWILPAALVLGGLYLGFMEKSANKVRAFKRVKNFGGALAVLAGVWFTVQYEIAGAHALAFRPYDEKAVQASIAAGRGVMLDFSADWCVPCHELELQTFPDAAVAAAARPFDAYRVDLTHFDSPDADRWRRQYGIKGVPTIVLLGAGGTEVRASRVEGFLAAAPFAERLRAASAGLR